MSDSSDGNNRGRGRQRQFRRSLQALKQEGCRILLTGDIGVDERAIQSARLFGKATDRHRILAATDLDIDDVRDHLPAQLVEDQPNAEVIRYDEIRSVSVSDTYGAPPYANTNNEFAAFRWRLVDAIARHRVGRTPSPAELRVGVATLAPLIDEHGTQTVEELVQVVGDETVRSRGMAHYHLGLNADSTAAESLLPLMDVHIELRHREGSSPEHRWTLLDHNVHTQWIPLRR